MVRGKGENNDFKITFCSHNSLKIRLYNILLEYELTRGLELALLILEMCFLNIWELAPNTGRMLFH